MQKILLLLAEDYSKNDKEVHLMNNANKMCK